MSVVRKAVRTMLHGEPERIKADLRYSFNYLITPLMNEEGMCKSAFVSGLTLLGSIHGFGWVGPFLTSIVVGTLVIVLARRLHLSVPGLLKYTGFAAIVTAVSLGFAQACG